MKNLSPAILEKTKNGDVFFDIQSKLYRERIIFLYEEIDDSVASVIVPLLFMLDNEDHEKKISFWIHSNGGEISAAKAIIDMMQIIKAPVETVCIGAASSAAAVLVAAGNKGTRSCTPNSRFMIHQAISGVRPGPASHVLTTSKEIEFENNNMLSILADHTGQPFDKLKMDCEHDLYMNPKEAIEYGIVDRIIPYSKPIQKAVKPENPVLAVKRSKVRIKK